MPFCQECGLEYFTPRIICEQCGAELLIRQHRIINDSIPHFTQSFETEAKFHIDEVFKKSPALQHPEHVTDNHADIGQNKPA